MECVDSFKVSTYPLPTNYERKNILSNGKLCSYSLNQVISPSITNISDNLTL